MAIPSYLVIGIGAPIVTAALTGLVKTKEDVKTYSKFLGIAAVSTIATAALAEYYFPRTAAAAVPCPSCPPVMRSVSGVTVQLGRYAGGVNYPGQIRDVETIEDEAVTGGVITVD